MPVSEGGPRAGSIYAAFLKNKTAGTEGSCRCGEAWGCGTLSSLWCYSNPNVFKFIQP